MNKPNVIVIMTDQQRADVSARYGFPLDTTPFLDRMARQGIWFDKAYTASPICVAARCSMLTGRYPGAHRVRENGGSRHANYTQDVFDVMKGQGYATALIGKNHTYLTADSPSLDHHVPLNHFGDPGTFPSGAGRSIRSLAEPAVSMQPGSRTFSGGISKSGPRGNGGIGLGGIVERSGGALLPVAQLSRAS
ncbi:sulfatase-like hydrolase/transferase [Paenibacillus sp. TAB 01]|uniref:sulfatase-like hydrolase/transferase n=1 Tax=Paenibacillus sp. TAB 01 TaxID=3368988 RepID=UPI0037521FB7